MVIPITQYLTIIIYHYVRDLSNTRYPQIKGLLTSRFIGQLEYCMKYYTIVSMEDCINSFLGKIELPKDACLLTFDDGFIDHYTTVFPILNKMGISGAFFPPAKPILKNKLLDVHKIHFILANTTDYKDLTTKIFKILKPFRITYKIPDDKTLYLNFADASEWDPPEVVFIKRLLQTGLPKEVRSKISSELFEQVVKVNEQTFSRELYMTMDQLKLMRKYGMYIGGHGFTHQWLGKITEEEQRKEIKHNYKFLEEIYNEKPINWVMSYPHGSFNQTTISILKEFDCAIGLAATTDLAPLNSEIRFNIPRLDTNHIPFSAENEPNKWTKKILN